VVGGLKTGDYIGIYSELDGLDVSHVGIFIRMGSSSFLRHASSKKEIRQVVDEAFMEDVRNKPGIIILRTKVSGKDSSGQTDRPVNHPHASMPR
jgi:hypothetical protein